MTPPKKKTAAQHRPSRTSPIRTSASPGLDRLLSGNGNDNILVGDGNDTVTGGGGNDSLTLSDDAVGNGNLGDDTLTLSDRAVGHGSFGNDTFTVSDDAKAFGEGGNDTFQVYNNGFAKGGDDDDTAQLRGNAVFRGEGGNDDILARGDATAYGQDGTDTLDLRGNAEGHGGRGNDDITATDSATAFGAAGFDDMTATGQATISGGNGNDVMQGTGDGNPLSGQPVVNGDAGDDQIGLTGGATGFGGTGSDEITVLNDGQGNGGADDDFMAVLNGGTILGDDGDDQLVIDRAHSGATAPNLALANQNDITANGGAGDDLFVVKSHANTARFGSTINMTGGEGGDDYLMTTGVFQSDDGYTIQDGDWTGAAPTPPATSNIGTITDFNPAEDTLVVELFDTGESPYYLSDMDTVASASGGVDLHLYGTNINDPDLPPIERILTIDGITSLDLSTIRLVGDVDDSTLVQNDVDLTGKDVTTVSLDDTDQTITALPGTLVNTNGGADVVTGPDAGAADAPNTVLNLGSGDDVFTAGAGYAAVNGGLGNDTFNVPGTATPPDTSITEGGTGEQNLLHGGAGADTFNVDGHVLGAHGGDGADVFNLGADATGDFDGGANADRFSFGYHATVHADAADTLVFNADTGNAALGLTGQVALSNPSAGLPDVGIALPGDWVGGTDVTVATEQFEDETRYQVSVGGTPVLTMGDLFTETPTTITPGGPAGLNVAVSIP